MNGNQKGRKQWLLFAERYPWNQFMSHISLTHTPRYTPLHVATIQLHFNFTIQTPPPKGQESSEGNCPMWMGRGQMHHSSYLE